MARPLSSRAGIRKARASALGLAFALAVGAQTSGAATDETEPIRLEYTAPATCPNAEDFGRRVFGRTSKARAAEGSEPARTFVVVIEASGAEAQGSLVVREDGMSTLARRVSGKNCDEVARALALATALAIDPEAALEVPEPPAPADGGVAGSAGTAAGTTTPPQDDKKPPVSTPPDETPKKPRADERMALLFGAAAAFGPAPNPSFGASAGLEWGGPGAHPSAFGADFVFLTSADHAVASAESSFMFAFARPYACPIGVGSGADLAFMPCVGAELGAVIAKGSGLENPESETRFWAAGELTLRLDVALSDEWFLDATGGIVFPFTRYRFVFRTPDTAIHDVPAVTAVAGLRAGRRF